MLLKFIGFKLQIIVTCARQSARSTRIGCVSNRQENHVTNLRLPTFAWVAAASFFNSSPIEQRKLSKHSLLPQCGRSVVTRLISRLL